MVFGENPNSMPVAKPVNKQDERSQTLMPATPPQVATLSSQELSLTTRLPNAIQAYPIRANIQPMELAWKMLGLVDVDRVQNDLRLLSGEEPICIENQCYSIKNRLTGSDGLVWAKKYIYNQLIASGYNVNVQDWSLSGFTDQNIIARKKGLLNPNEEIYFVAHLDGVKIDGESFPAADDNASGVADLLELARVTSGFSFDRTVTLLFTTGEEQGTLGVKSYLDRLSPGELSSIKYALNLDMVGYDANQDCVMELWHGGEGQSINLANMLVEIIEAYQLDLKPVLVVGCG